MDGKALSRLGLLYHPFVDYPDQRGYTFAVFEQRKVMQQALEFIQSSQENNLAVFSFPPGCGRTTMARLTANSIQHGIDYSLNRSVWIEGFGMGSARLFLMRLLEALELPGSRANEKRIETFCDWLKEQAGLAIVLDGLPEYIDDLAYLLGWARKSNLKLKVLLFESIHFDINLQLGRLGEHLGLYQTTYPPTQAEITSVLISRMRLAGLADPAGLMNMTLLEEIALVSYPSLRKAIRLAHEQLERIAQQKIELDRLMPEV